ncbi:DUF924 family protein [Stappia sp.]|uniref:DUF924 family protein n=1 Tax=Stappia sp. TaxID=1870903 RepID=UPI003A98E07F
MTMDKPTPFDVLDFWWTAGPQKWFARSDAFDAEIRERFEAASVAAGRGDLDDWATTPHGALALIILLDQFPRNLYRNDARAFASDQRALKTAERALEQGFDKAFPTQARTFFYLPFEHAEDIAAQERSVDLFRRLANQETYFYALLHLDVIRRFGRFPHRNPVLGRETSPAEAAYLADGGFGS